MGKGNNKDNSGMGTGRRHHHNGGGHNIGDRGNGPPNPNSGSAGRDNHLIKRGVFGHGLTVGELKEMTRARLAKEADTRMRAVQGGAGGGGIGMVEGVGGMGRVMGEREEEDVRRGNGRERQGYGGQGMGRREQGFNVSDHGVPGGGGYVERDYGDGRGGRGGVGGGHRNVGGSPNVNGSQGQRQGRGQEMGEIWGTEGGVNRQQGGGTGYQPIDAVGNNGNPMEWVKMGLWGSNTNEKGMWQDIVKNDTAGNGGGNNNGVGGSIASSNSSNTVDKSNTSVNAMSAQLNASGVGGKSPKMVAKASIVTRMRMGSEGGSKGSADSEGYNQTNGGDGVGERSSLENSGSATLHPPSPNARLGARMLQIVQESFEKGEITEREKDRRKKGIFMDTKKGKEGGGEEDEVTNVIDFNRVSITQG